MIDNVNGFKQVSTNQEQETKLRILPLFGGINTYPITPLKGAAPLSGSIKDSTIFWKKNRQKRVHAPFF